MVEKVSIKLHRQAIALFVIFLLISFHTVTLYFCPTFLTNPKDIKLPKSISDQMLISIYF